MQIQLDMYQTAAVAVFSLFVGDALKKRIYCLEKFCIPAPVIGGILFSLFTCLCHIFDLFEISFDDVLKDVCMVMFFTSVGFQANLKVIKSGGKSMFIFLCAVITLIVSQNFLAVSLSKMLGINPLIGMCTGSIPMVGGHGTAGAFGDILEQLGVKGANTLCTASATFGLVAGSLMGGPLGMRLINKHNLMLKVSRTAKKQNIKAETNNNIGFNYTLAIYQIIMAIGIGTIISSWLMKGGMTFPIYVGAMIAAAIIRNVGEFSGGFNIYINEINGIGSVSLNIFLGIAMITLRLWELAALAIPMIVLLLGQVILMFLFAELVIFNIMGRDYDAAVLTSGICGFGMGATPNAMANMQVVTERYAKSAKAFILVPLVGSLFADFINSLVITLFINGFGI